MHSIIFLFGGGHGLDSDGVQLALALAGDLPASILSLLDQTHLLKLLQDVPAALTSGPGVDVLLYSTAELTSVDLAERTNSDAATDVDLADHGGCPDIEPIGIVGSELL